jgi:hypothetical protein
MISLDADLATTMLQAIIDKASDGADAPYICIYDGLVPVGLATALTTQNQLAKLTCSDPCATVVGKTLTFEPITADTAADAAGDAAFFRLYTSTGAPVLQGSVSDADGSGDLKLGSVTVIQNGTVTITSAVLTLP